MRKDDHARTCDGIKINEKASKDSDRPVLACQLRQSNENLVAWCQVEVDLPDAI